MATIPKSIEAEFGRVACPRRALIRKVQIGGVSQNDLLLELEQGGFLLNEAGRTLLLHDSFSTASNITVIETCEMTVADLGFVRGASMADIFDRASQIGMVPCPIELAPHLRLQYQDQPEGAVGQLPTQHRAPPGSLTITSKPVAMDEDTPKGFYLRRMEGVLWLRGYRSGPEQVWSPQDRLLFALQPAAA